jgi:ABC-type uncharacterized transport system permease subunit
VVNIALHAAVTVLFTTAVRRMLCSASTAVLAGVLFAVIAYRKGNQVALASLVLNLLVLALVVFQLQGKPTPYDPQAILEKFKALTPL